jgi:hypothetical protein
MYRLFFGILAAVLVSNPAQATLARMGPSNPDPRVGGYPAWYQDSTGLALEFCSLTSQAEVDGGWCLLLPADAPVLPESYPAALAGTGSFGEEHFYYDATAGIKNPGSPVKATLVIALEAANVPLTTPLVFSRIRYKLGGAPGGYDYRFIHPYGDEVQFMDPSSAQFSGSIFVTDDTGLACADFSCAMNGRFGPYLLPSATPGGAELPPVTPTNPAPDSNPANFGGALTVTPYPFAPGDPKYGTAYLADPARVGPITGSPLPNFTDSTGASRNHNIFRIEAYLPGTKTLATACNATVPANTQPCVDLDGLGNNFIETTLFSVAGRVYGGTMPGQVKIDRASYDRNSSGESLQVFASGIEPGSARLPGQPTPAPTSPKLSFFNAACTATGDAAGTLAAPSATTAEIPLAAQGTAPDFWARTAATHAPQVCMKDAAARDISGAIVPAYFQASVTDQVTVTSAVYDPTLLSLTVSAISSDTIAPPALTLDGFGSLNSVGSITVPFVVAPPSSVRVSSSSGGSASLLVTTAASTPPPPPVTPPTAPPVAGNDAFNVPSNAVGVLDILANDSNVNSTATITITSAPLQGALAAVPSPSLPGLPALAYSPVAGAAGVDVFSYTVTVGGQTSNVATVTVNLVAATPIAVNDTFPVTQGAVATLNLTANDTDPSGLTIIGIAGLTQPGGGATVTDLGGGLISFTAATPGAYAFTYLAVDSAGFVSAAPGTVTVNVIAADNVAISTAKFTIAQARWVVTGTDSTPGNKITIAYDATGPQGGTVLGFATVDPLGNWTFDTRGVSGVINPTTFPAGVTRPSRVQATSPNAATPSTLAIQFK